MPMSLASIAQPTPDWPTVLVLSDYFEEAGRQAWADALRWMARRKKWPGEGRFLGEHEDIKFIWKRGDCRNHGLPTPFFFSGHETVWFVPNGEPWDRPHEMGVAVSVEGFDPVEGFGAEAAALLVEKALEYVCRMWEVREKEILFYLELTGQA